MTVSTVTGPAAKTPLRERLWRLLAARETAQAVRLATQNPTAAAVLLAVAATILALAGIVALALALGYALGHVGR